MRIIQSVAPELSVALTNDNKLVVMVETDEGEFLAEVTDIDRLVAALRHVDLVRAENPQDRPPMITTAEVELNRRQAPPAGFEGRCQVHLIHADKSEAQCVLDKTHLLNDSDHVDQHGHHAPVLVHQSTIRQVKAIQDARDAGLIE